MMMISAQITATFELNHEKIEENLQQIKNIKSFRN